MRHGRAEKPQKGSWPAPLLLGRLAAKVQSNVTQNAKVEGGESHEEVLRNRRSRRRRCPHRFRRRRNHSRSQRSEHRVELARTTEDRRRAVHDTGWRDGQRKGGRPRHREYADPDVQRRQPARQQRQPRSLLRRVHAGRRARGHAWLLLLADGDLRGEARDAQVAADAGRRHGQLAVRRFWCPASPSRTAPGTSGSRRRR